MPAPILQFKRGNAGVAGTVPALRSGEPAFTLNNFDLFVGFDTSVVGNKFFGSHRYWGREDGTTALRLKLVDKNGSNSVNIKAPDTLSGITTYTLPETPVDGYFLKTNSIGTLSWEQVVSNINIAADSGTPDSVSTGSTITFTGGEGIDTAVSNDTITISAELASTTNAGVASFSSADFTVTNGLVELASTIDFANAEFDNVLVTGISTFNGNITLGDAAEDTITINGTTTFTQPIVGTISTATRATLVDTTGTSDAATYFITFVDTAAGQQGETVRVSTGASYVPSTNKLSVTTLSATNIQAADGTSSLTLTNTTGAVTAANDLTVQGNLYVNGSTTQINTTELTVNDRTITLGIQTGTTPTTTTWDLGVLMNYGDAGVAKTAGVIWEYGNERFVFAANSDNPASLSTSTPNITVSTYAPIEVAELWVNNTCTGGSSQIIGCVNSELQLQNIVVDAGSY